MLLGPARPAHKIKIHRSMFKILMVLWLELEAPEVAEVAVEAVVVAVAVTAL